MAPPRRAAEAAAPDVLESQNFMREQVKAAPPKLGHFAGAPFDLRPFVVRAEGSRPGQAPAREPHPRRDGSHAALGKVPAHRSSAVNPLFPPVAKVYMNFGQHTIVRHGSIFDFHAMRKKFVDFRFSCDAQKICRFSIFLRCAKNLSIFDFHVMRKKFVDFRFSCDAQRKRVQQSTNTKNVQPQIHPTPHFMIVSYLFAQ